MPGDKYINSVASKQNTMAEDDFTTIRISKEVKEEFDKQRNLPQGEVSSGDFLNYLLEQNKKRK